MTVDLDTLQSREFRLSELEQAAADLLGQATGAIGDGRVASVPDARTLRYYQSTGIMDRPLRYDGRAAVYGSKSLLQAVCVKLLQARGYSLAQCQGALAGAPIAQLETAVRESIGDAKPTPPPPAVSEPPAPARLVAVQVAPGVVVTIDPAAVSNPDDVIRRIQSVLNQGETP